MPLRYKIDVLVALKQVGYTTYTLRKQQLLGESTIHKLRQGQGISWDKLEVLCRLLQCNIGDICEYIPAEIIENNSKK